MTKRARKTLELLGVIDMTPEQAAINMTRGGITRIKGAGRKTMLEIEELVRVRLPGEAYDFLDKT